MTASRGIVLKTNVVLVVEVFADGPAGSAKDVCYACKNSGHSPCTMCGQICYHQNYCSVMSLASRINCFFRNGVFPINFSRDVIVCPLTFLNDQLLEPSFFKQINNLPPVAD